MPEPSAELEPCGAAFHGAPSCTCPDVVARRLALLKAAFSIGPHDMFPDNRPAEDGDG